jgi:hypothetical protein
MKTTTGAQGHEGAFLGHDAPRGTGALPYIGNAPCDAPTGQGQGQSKASIPSHPLDIENVTKFALGVAVTAELEASGKYHLLVTTPADCTTPDHLKGRRIMHAIPITSETAEDLHKIILGTHRAVRIKPSSPIATNASQATPARQ